MGIYVGDKRYAPYVGDKRRKVMQSADEPAPEGYRLVSYIENISNAYIDTDYVNTLDVSYEIDFQLTDYTADNKIIGQTQKYGLATYKSKWRVIYNGNFQLKSAADGNRHIGSYSSGTYKIDDTSIASNVSIREGTQSTCIFTIKQWNGAALNGVCYAKVYSCKIWDSNVLVRDYIPVQRISDDKYGLWDKVNKTFNLSPNNVDFNGG